MMSHYMYAYGVLKNILKQVTTSVINEDNNIKI